MAMWIIIFWTTLAFALLCLLYIAARVPKLAGMKAGTKWGRFRHFLLGLLIVLGAAGAIALCLDTVNAIVCVICVAMIWAACDVAFWMLGKFAHKGFERYYGGWAALAASILALGGGWYADHHVWQAGYELVTQKEVPDLRLAMFADAHVGTTFNAGGFARHLENIQAQNPDVLMVVGDYVDDGTTREDMVNATKALGQVKAKYGVYFVSGNHDKGYWGAAQRGFSEQDLFDELKKNGIAVLRDESVLLGNAFYLIGRRDYSEARERGGTRASMEELVRGLDKSKYMIVLDHQPADFARQAAAKVDLVLCGHTHGGQLFPFNQVGKWIGANDLVYGHERRGSTDFIVTSGISDWAIKFKTGTRSEFVIVNIRRKR